MKAEIMEDMEPIDNGTEVREGIAVVAGTTGVSQVTETTDIAVDDSGKPDGGFRAKVDEVMEEVRRRTQACPPSKEQVYAAVEEEFKGSPVEPTLQMIRRVYFSLLRRCHGHGGRTNLGWR